MYYYLEHNKQLKHKKSYPKNQQIKFLNFPGSEAEPFNKSNEPNWVEIEAKLENNKIPEEINEPQNEEKANDLAASKVNVLMASKLNHKNELSIRISQRLRLTS